MHRDFNLSNKQFLEIARQMAEKTKKGLKEEGNEILCIPTFVPIQSKKPSGRLLVMDLGGTNVRCAQVLLENGRLEIERGPVKEKLAVEYERDLGLDEFLERLAGIIHSLGPEQGLPLGYCFSYPTEPTRDGDAILLQWTKELSVSDTVGRKVGEMLCGYLSMHNASWQCTRVKVINDTVAALLAGMGTLSADAFIGLIVGTGTNMAISLHPGMIPKILEGGAETYALPVNLESGNFYPPFLTQWDAQLDKASNHPGQHRFEKAVSGHYLANLLKLSMPECNIDIRRGAAAVFDKAYGASAGSNFEMQLARQIVERSAGLVAASIAGIIALMREHRSMKIVAIAAEGGVFWGHPAYKERVESTLTDLLLDMGLPDICCKFLAVDHANLHGSAIAGLSE